MICILASRSSPLAQLNLALAWNRVDVAESDIFTENSRFQVRQLKYNYINILNGPLIKRI
jgi:hypothetical protein